MNLFQALLLSIVEGITEFLPISSTGHLILVSNLLKIPQTEFVKSFEIVIQLGAILAVVAIYFRKIITNLDAKLWKNIIVAFLPSAIFGLIFYKYIKLYLIGNSTVVIWSLLIGGVAMLLFERFHKFSSIRYTLSPIRYLVIGLFQVLSMIPGVSRAFATIFGGMVVGLNRKEAVEFSFFLAIPTMFGATVLDIYKTKIWLNPTPDVGLLIIGFFASFLTAYFVIKWFIKFVESHNFTIFGWYRIILALIFLFYL